MANGKKKKGLIIVNTGDGKGKTTSAMGIALRAAGHGMKSVMVQFIKGSWSYGELISSKKLGNFDIFPMGRGFTWESENIELDRQAAQKAWEMCKEKALSGEYNIAIFDEINYAIHLGLIDVKEVVDFLKNKPEELHLILTGRNASKEIIKLADMVTEMKEIKHPFKKGIVAQKGIEY